jgi:tRNA dimethylallyltransferase
MYKGLEISTNKLSKTDMHGITHHFISFLDVDQEINPATFSNSALKILNDIHSRDHLPIVVGGTHYYLESLLFENYLFEEPSIRPEPVPILEESSWDALQIIDPKMAEKLHPNDKRKIKRSIEIFNSTGKSHSSLCMNKKTKLR